MSRLKSSRKPRESAEPNLYLVPPPKPKRRRRFKIGHIWKAKFPPELLRFEEDVVLRAVEEAGGRASVESLERLYPERFRRKQLWWTLVRLAGQGRLHNGRMRAFANEMDRLRSGSPFLRLYHSKAWFQRHKVRTWEEFWI